MLLIKHGATVNIQQKDGSTPLHKAAKEGYLAVVRILLSNGAAVNAKTNNGLTAFDLAEQNGHSIVLQMLQDNGAVQTAKVPSARAISQKDATKPMKKSMSI